MSEVQTWSKTAASNNANPPNGFPEKTDGYIMQFSEVNNSMREFMAAYKRWVDDVSGTLTLTLDNTVGSSRYYTVTLNQSLTSLSEGIWFRAFLETPAIMIDMLLNVNGISDIQVLEANGTAVQNGDLNSATGVSSLYTFRYNGTNWIIS